MKKVDAPKAEGVNLSPEIRRQEPDMYCPEGPGAEGSMNFWKSSCQVKREMKIQPCKSCHLFGGQGKKKSRKPGPRQQRHGQPKPKHDKAILEAVRKYPKLSKRAIAEMVGCGESTVWKALRKHKEKQGG